jgi:tripeptidyl-peptidase-2
VLEANDGILTLSSGKNLILNPEWKTSVGGKYHVGTEAAYNLFPKLLVERLKIERREKFDISQRDAMNEVQRHLAEWQRNNPQDTDDVKLLRIRKDLKSRLAQLEDLSKNYEDPGPIYDCVVFYDGENWRAAVDTKETGDFTGVPAMTDFKIERQYARFSEESQLNYCLNVYDDGNILSIVCDAGAHGTHVAGIVAAYHPDQPECNGIAPGAQIISVKIGDTRLGSMETTTALSRAIQAIINSKCDIVNMSYGEYAGDHNIGRIVELAKELVEEHNITFVCSAGNNGPSLGSVGAPGGSSTCLLGVGAYVSPRMMDAEYIMRDNDLTGNLYTWSSRGPTFDGDLGVNICAPGAAIAPVPNWTLNKKQLMNGTSMSSPNCAGNISLMLSGLKDQGIEYNAYSIRRTLEKTSVKLDKVEVFAQGKGLIQVLPAFENMIRYCNQFDGTKKFPLYYEVKASSLNSGRGIFLKDAGEFLHDSTEVQVNVKPVFHKIAPQEHKVHFEMHINFIPTARWIEVGKHLAVMHEGRAFKVLLKTKNLPVGDNYAEIAAYDAANHEIGPLFTIPVIVIKPEKIEALPAVVKYRKDLTPGMISRRFFDPPSDATWADITICRSTNEEFESNSSSKLYVLHMMQFEVHERQSLTSYKKSFSLKPGEQVTHSCDVRGGLTIEVCLAQFWSALGNSSAEVKVEFHGIVPNQEKIHLSGGEGAKKVLVRSTITTETLNPQVSFNKWIQRLRPNSSEISPLSSARDIFPDKRQVYQLILTYAFSKKECGKVSPRLPLLNGRLYESPFEGQMCQIFDDLKRYIGASDAYPEGISLKKGSYTIRAQIRHEDVSKLEKLKNAILFLDHDIKDLSAKVYGGPDDPAIGGKLVENR